MGSRGLMGLQGSGDLPGSIAYSTGDFRALVGKLQSSNEYT
jgi:hypothetical protein